MTTKQEILKDISELVNTDNFMLSSDYDQTVISNNTFTDEQMKDEQMIRFSNYVLQDRFLKLCKINESFVEGVLDLNQSFFSITDADVCNYKDAAIKDSL